MLSIIAVAIDDIEVTQRFVSSIRQYTTGEYELILIDNGSRANDSIEYLKRSSDLHFRFPETTDLAKAWNKGIELASGATVAVVNNDVVVPRDWFAPLYETLTKNENAAVVSPLTLQLIEGHLTLGNLSQFDLETRAPFKLLPFEEVIMGEFCVFKRAALEDVGGYLEIYEQASGEDMEMCFALFDKGYEVMVDPRVFVHHEGGATTALSGDQRTTRWKTNFELFKSRWPQYTKDW